MSNKLTVETSTGIDATPAEVWEAFTDPAMIKQYLFGTDARSDWKIGSPITYSGEWNGKPYTDKGTIVDMIPERMLHTTYFSGMSGKEDIPENYANVIYEIEPEDDGHTLVTITQDNIENAEGVKHMQENWSMVLDGMKKLLEKGGK